MAREKTKRITSIGGQALIEGIMMRGPKRTEISVRMPDGTISSETLETDGLGKKYKIFRLPIFRGIAAFIDSLSTGFKALNISAEKSGMAEEEGEPSKFDQWMERVFGDKLMNAIMAVGTVLGLLLAIVLFFFLPTWLFNVCEQYLFGTGIEAWRSIIEGAMRIGIFVAYIAIVAHMSEIKRVFEYHGAEHKTIFCYEAGLPLTVENVRKQPRHHPRCGTSFLFMVIAISILVSTVVFGIWPVHNALWRFVAHLLMLPIIVGVSYEFNRWAGRHDGPVTKLLTAPGLWLQNFTTFEPDDSMIEVGIKALELVLPEVKGEDAW